jgi:hypothetical protein
MYTTPAERLRGCIFSDDFTRNADVMRNGGTISSAPVIHRGVTFDGADDKIAYSVVTGVKSVSFWITLATVSESIAALDATHTIAAAAGVLVAAGWAAPTYYVNGVATSTIGLGRSHVVITTATAFNCDAIALAYIAAAGDPYGALKIEQLRFWSVALTAQEIADLKTGSTFLYQKKNVLMHLPMRAQDHDPVNKRTLDVSGNGRHATHGDGATATTYPTKLATSGYSFDGGDYMDVASKPQIGTSDHTAFQSVLTQWVTSPQRIHSGISGCMARLDGASDINRVGADMSAYFTDDCVGTPRVNWTTGAFEAELPAESANSFGAASIYDYRGLVAANYLYSNAGVAKAAYGDYCKSPMHWNNCGVYDRDGNLTTYKDGAWQAETSIAAYVAEDLTSAFKYLIGSRQTLASVPDNFFQANALVKYVFVSSRALTPVQVADLHMTALQAINNV